MPDASNDSENHLNERKIFQNLDHVPFQQRVVSASQLPVIPTSISAFSHAASPRYVQQYRALIEDQRQVFEAERVLWHVERVELHEKIAQLETSLSQYQAIASSHDFRPIDTNRLATSKGLSVGGVDGVKRISAGDEFWRGSGGKSDAQPTRTFGNLLPPSMLVDRLPGVSDNFLTHRMKATSFPVNVIDSENLRIGSPRAVETDKNLDGITFRKSSLAPTITESLIKPEGSSSQVFKSLSRASPVLVPLPSSSLSPGYDPYTKDAGHTPLARRSELNLDGVISSDLATPTKPEVEKPPLEPPPSVTKLPSERADSYFPALGEETDGDAILQGPLGLTNNGPEDNKFLTELDSKLFQAANSNILAPPAFSELDKENMGKDKSFDEPEPEPKLRIKRSMNFGSQFGAASCGKRF